MKATHKNIERIVQLLNNNIMTINATLDYERIQDAFILLCKLVNDYCDDEENEGECLWYIGEFSYVTLDALIVGAYWHFTEWHGGQSSKSYATLCELGSIFSPGMSDGPEGESAELDVYNLLNEIAENEG
jgi:hypothetical protein